jgi:hypothetical protein
LEEVESLNAASVEFSFRVSSPSLIWKQRMLKSALVLF